MTFEEVLNNVINDGIEGAKRDYANDPDKLKGSVEGFEACRGKSMKELITLLRFAAQNRMKALSESTPNYWEIRCFEAEVEWACNCMSAYMVIQGQKPVVTVTARAALAVDGIIRRRIN